MEGDKDIQKYDNQTLREFQFNVISALMQFEVVFLYQVKNIITPECLVNDTGRFFWHVLREIIEQNLGIDELFFEQYCGFLGYQQYFQKNKDKILSALNKLKEHKVSQKNAVECARILARRCFKNKIADGLIKLQADVTNLPENTPSDVTSNTLVEFVRKFAASEGDEKMELLGDDIKEYVDDLINGEPSAVGIDVGFPLFAAGSGGILPGTVTCISARLKSGKCSEKSTIVTFDDGRQHTIGEIVDSRIEGNVIAWDGQEFRPCKIIDWINSGKQKCYKITTKTGRTIGLTNTHPLLGPTGWKKVKDFSVGDTIAVPKVLDYFGNNKVTIDEAAFIAYLTADGSVINNIGWTKNDERLVVDFKDICKGLGWELRRDKGKGHDKYHYHIVSCFSNQGRFKKCDARLLCEKFGIYGCKSTEKQVSPLIMGSTREVIARFLQVLISSDGSFVCNSAGRCRIIEYSTSSEVLANQVFSLLIRFGIVAKMGSRYTTYSNSSQKFQSWRITISSEEHVQKYLQEIGWLRDIPEMNTNGKSRSLLDMIPHEVVGDMLKVLTPGQHPRGTLHDHFNVAQSNAINKSVRTKTSLMRQTLLMAKKDHPIIKGLLETDIMWDEIVAIEPLGVCETYDIEVEGLHNFVANNIIIHNSSMLLNIATNTAKNGIPTLFLDHEMQRRQTQNRILANISGVNLNAIKYKTFNRDPELVEKVKEASEIIENLPLTWKKASTMTVDQYLSYTRRWLAKTVGFNEDGTAKECLLVLDYLKTGSDIGENTSKKEWELLGEIAGKLKDFANEYSVPVVTAVQLNRMATQGPRGNNANIGGSDRIAQYVDTVWELSKKTESETSQDNADLGEYCGNVVLVQTAVRDAESLGTDNYLAMDFNGSLMRFTEKGMKYSFMKIKEKALKKQKPAETTVPI